MSTATTLLTAEEFLKMPDNGRLTELVKGVVIEMPPPTPRHGQVCIKMGRILGNFAEDNNLGHVVGNDSAIITERSPDSVRGADLSYYSYQRVPPGPMPIGYVDIAPEMVIEVRSPSDRWPAIYRKAAEYLDAGITLVVILDPENGTAQLLRSDTAVRIIPANGELDLSEVVPGFRVSLARIFG
jgi:Uma2 family endonuclease